MGCIVNNVTLKTSLSVPKAICSPGQCSYLFFTVRGRGEQTYPSGNTTNKQSSVELKIEFVWNTVCGKSVYEFPGRPGLFWSISRRRYFPKYRLPCVIFLRASFQSVNCEGGGVEPCGG